MSSHCAQATSVHEQVYCQTHLPFHLPCLVARESTDGRSSWYNEEWAPPSKHEARNSYSGWSKRGTRGNPTEYEGRFHQWDEGRPRDSARGHETDVEVEVEVLEGRDKSQDCDGTRDVVEVPQASSDSAHADATNADMIRTKLWEPQRLLNHRKGSLSATKKKNSEANTRAYDFNQKTMQALDTLAEEYEAFEVTMMKVCV